MIKQFVNSQYCLNECRCCCKFSQQESVWSPALLDSEILEFEKNQIPRELINKHKKISLLLFAGSEKSDLPDHVGPIYSCPFLNPVDSKCKVYQFRPTECQIYPFLINRRGGTVFLSVDPGCPYVREKLKSIELNDYARYLGGYFNNPLATALLKANPQIIQVYDDAVDIIEIKL